MYANHPKRRRDEDGVIPRNNVIHIIPFDDNSTRNCTKINILDSNSESMGRDNKRRRKMLQMSKNSQAESASTVNVSLHRDAIMALKDVKALTQTIGSSVVMNEAMLVNQRVFNVQNRQRGRKCKSVTNASTSSSSNSDDSKMEDSSSVFAEEWERQSILVQACRMKRITNMFRTLNKLQDLLIRDVYDCCAFEDENAELLAAQNASVSAGESDTK